MKKKELLFATTVLMFLLLVTNCSVNDANNMDGKGMLALKVTDAPTDDSNIEGTFITVANVKINGKPVEGFVKQTIEISAYQNGNEKLIFNDQVKADSYNSMTLVIDYETDATGNSPGCYVLTDDDMKHDLNTSASMDSEITLDKTFSVESNSETSLVVDFDLRRSIVRDTTNNESDYRFVSDAELQSAIRVANEEMTGEISGKVQSTINSGDETYVFVYHKGDFDLATESHGQGSSNVLFANAVSSAKVGSDGTYNLSFLEEGNYEIHVASFVKESESKTTFSGMLNASSTISGLLLNNISVSSKTVVTLNIQTNEIL